MKDVLIKLRNVGKKYQLTDERRTLVKSVLSPFEKPREVWALKNINLEIKRGETIGIIGENGSGKSTLLKLIAGITSPTKGSIKVNGRVGSLIELGAGFHPDLTGRENVYLNGTLLGFTKRELDKKYQEIVDFADIGEYINQPVRTYSSGMAVRLGFSVAIHLDPEVLLIDEVLAVGDEDFQRKCINSIHQLQQKQITILFVSHHFNLVTNVCKKAILLDKGRIKTHGEAKKVINFYLDNVVRQSGLANQKGRWGSGKVVIGKVHLLNSRGNISSIFYEEDTMVVKVKVKCKSTVEDPVFGIAIRDYELKDLFATNTLWRGLKVGLFKKGEEKIITYYFKENFPPGDYYISPAIASSSLGEYYDWRDNYIHFTVKNRRKNGTLIPRHSISIKAL